ncbi:hypothetical protein L3X38_033608 [Prunus dulcis]|uniref:Reverse transcriptase Ty1/copia-type domain-containing protein n=1 Tax=Prunus dulcis TaxID=3755 RepID=A0AAD4YX28_PRUDU|nr:hypothetical protein L3X38_033608 [Prunus dulcis]
MNTVRVLLSLIANLDWSLKKFDVKNAFMDGDLEEEVYIDMPPGYGLSNNSRKVCKLRKALYGLKQSPRAWLGRFTEAMKKYGYHQGNSDHTLFIKHIDGKITLLIIYVNDMVVTSDDVVEMGKLQKYLASEFEMKDLGALKYFLGIELTYSATSTCLFQRKYVLDLLTDIGMLGCALAETSVV